MSSSPSPAEDSASRTHFAILGAGPTGIEAALGVAERGYSFTLYERAPSIAGNVRGWGHVRLFTPWSMNVSNRMRATLEANGHELPAESDCPTGHELVEHLYRPLAEAEPLRGNLELGTQVVSVGRQGLLKHEAIGTGQRIGRPFRLLLRDRDGHESLASADVVLDCTGNSLPNALGDGGIPAPGETSLAQFVTSQVPDFGAEAEAWAGKTTLLVGAGHSAQTALVGFAELAESHPDSRLVWVVRGDGPIPASDDPLPERHRLVDRARRLFDHPPPWLASRPGSVVDALREQGGRLAVTLRNRGGDTDTVLVDRVLSLTGKVGDHLLYRQLQVHECYATSGPMKLAAALLSASGGGGDCLAQTSLGPETLRSPEPGFFILGSKSYGRRNDYLMRVGWQQVDEVLELLD